MRPISIRDSNLKELEAVHTPSVYLRTLQGRKVHQDACPNFAMILSKSTLFRNSDHASAKPKEHSGKNFPRDIRIHPTSPPQTFPGFHASLVKLFAPNDLSLFPDRKFTTKCYRHRKPRSGHTTPRTRETINWKHPTGLISTST